MKEIVLQVPRVFYGLWKVVKNLIKRLNLYRPAPIVNWKFSLNFGYFKWIAPVRIPLRIIHFAVFSKNTLTLELVFHKKIMPSEKTSAIWQKTLRYHLIQYPNCAIVIVDAIMALFECSWLENQLILPKANRSKKYRKFNILFFAWNIMSHHITFSEKRSTWGIKNEIPG